MSKFSGSEDIYCRLVEAEEEGSKEHLRGLMAFAIIEEQKVEWIRHQTENNGGQPNDADITSWYNQLPSEVLNRSLNDASTKLQAYGSSIIDDYLAEYEMEMRENVIVHEIKAAKNEIQETRKFWPQFGVNLAGGLVSSLLFATLLTALTFIILHDPLPIVEAFNKTPTK